MNWTEFPGAYLLSKVFSDSPPVGEIHIHKIELQENGPTVLIFFDLIGVLPDLPLKQWGKFNRCRIGLNCGNVKEFRAEGWGRNNYGFVKIEINHENEYKFHFNGDSTQIKFLCSDIQVMGPTVYLNE